MKVHVTLMSGRHMKLDDDDAEKFMKAWDRGGDSMIVVKEGDWEMRIRRDRIECISVNDSVVT